MCDKGNKNWQGRVIVDVYWFFGLTISLELRSRGNRTSSSITWSFHLLFPNYSCLASWQQHLTFPASTKHLFLFSQA